jgi:hypothetical protein
MITVSDLTQIFLSKWLEAVMSPSAEVGLGMHSGYCIGDYRPHPQGHRVMQLRLRWQTISLPSNKESLALVESMVELVVSEY